MLACRKIKLKKVARFSSLFNDHQHTTFHHESTTQLPSKNHVQTPAFLKTPLKNTSKTALKPSTSRPYFFYKTTVFFE
jgi:hypothetical protein